MIEQNSEKTVEQYLETLKTLLGGTLPEKIQPNASPSAASYAALSMNKHTDGRQHTEPISSKESNAIQVESVSDTTNNSLRAPLLYPPLNALSHPAQSTPAFATIVKSKPEAHGSTSNRRSHEAKRYCPLMAVVKFPYKFVGHEYRQAVASALFDGGKVWNREWKLYYIWCEEAAIDGPVVFVEEAQFCSLIAEINSAFPNLKWTLHERHEHAGLILSFPQVEQGLAPQYLGISHSRNDYDRLRSSINLNAPTRLFVHDKAILEPFYAVIELASNAGRNKPKSSTMQQQPGSISKAQRIARQLDSAREYLGIKGDHADVSAISVSGGPECNEGSFQASQTTAGDIVLIAIDCESYERDHNKITEVGIATLDTLKLREVPAGKCAEDWRQYIQGRHYRIAEYKHLVNKDFIEGCPNGFEFGSSEDVSVNNVASVLASCFKMAVNGEHGSSNHDSGTPDLRKMVLVGHDISQDITYCHKLGFSVLNRSNLAEVLDTASMFRTYSCDVNPRSLASIMHHFDMTAWNLHNAGNDAVYTLWALLAMCVETYKACGHHNQENTPELK